MRIITPTFFLGFFFLSLFAGIVLRPLADEGASFVFGMLNSGDFFYDRFFMRTSEALWQIPVLGLQRFYPELSIETAVLMQSLAQALHPAFSYLLTYAILRKKNKLEYWPIFLISMLLATYSTVFFAAGVVISALSFVWPIFAIACFYDENSWFDFTVSSVLLILLSNSHESSIFAVAGFSGCFVFYFFRARGWENKLFPGLLALVSLIGAFRYGSFLLFLRDSNQVSGFLKNEYTTLAPFRAVRLSFLVAFVTCIFVPKKHVSHMTKVVALFALAALLYYFSSPPLLEGAFADSRLGRKYAMALAVFLMTLIFLFKEKRFFIEAGKSVAIKILLVSFVTICFTEEIKKSVFWHGQMRALEKIAASAPSGCSLHTPQEANGGLSLDGIGFGLFQGLLLQKSYQPAKVIIMTTGHEVDAIDPVQTCYVRENSLYINFKDLMQLDGLKFKFDLLKPL